MKGQHNCYTCGDPCNCGSETSSGCQKCSICVEVDWDYEDYVADGDWGV